MLTDPDFYCIITARSDVTVIFTRFVCATILHLSVVSEVLEGLQMMKYAMNHRHKFQRYFWAFFIGAFKAVAGMGVELVSILVICAANSIVDVAMNFIALAIIADFDDFVFVSMRNESFS